MNNKIMNKQITVDKIIEVADYLEEFKDRYDNIFQQEEIKNKNLSYSEKRYEYENGEATVKYTISFYDGKSITENDYNWFLDNLNAPQNIKEIYIEMKVSFFGMSEKRDNNSEYKRVGAAMHFRDAGMNLRYSDADIDVEATRLENEANNVYGTLMGILEDTKDRYDNTIKHRKVRIQSFCISIGIILSYIIYLMLKINSAKLPINTVEYLNNKNIIIFGQWFVAILFGNICSYWYILSIYKPLLPDVKYAGYNKTTYKSEYKDDTSEYLEHSEVHIGKYADAEKRRLKIEKIFKITNKIVLVQLLISVLLYFILK